MSCQGNLLLMKVTSSTIIAMVVKLTCKCSIIELCVEKKLSLISEVWICSCKLSQAAIIFQA